MSKSDSARLTRRGALIGAAGGFAGAAALGSAGTLGDATERFSRTRVGMAFQTPVALTLVGTDTFALDHAMSAAFAAIRDVEHASSVYRATGELAALNRDGRLADPSTHLVTLMRYALALAAETGGRYDPTVQPLWDAWAAHHARGERPDRAALAPTLALVDWRAVRVADDLIAFDKPGMAVTLNSINQGYAADVVIATLADHGIHDAMVDTGEFGASGRHQTGRDWTLGVAAPREPATLAFTIDPFRRFAATSGDYQTAFSPDFRDHHIFDPRTGFSPPHWSSITVEAPSGLVADGLATALFASDPPAARRLLAAHPDCAARFFNKNGSEAVA